jgi:hypothetical protein
MRQALLLCLGATPEQNAASHGIGSSLPAASSLGVDALPAGVPSGRMIGAGCTMRQALGSLGIIRRDLCAHWLSVSHRGEQEARSLFGPKRDQQLREPEATQNLDAVLSTSAIEGLNGAREALTLDFLPQQ